MKRLRTVKKVNNVDISKAPGRKSITSQARFAAALTLLIFLCHILTPVAAYAVSQIPPTTPQETAGIHPGSPVAPPTTQPLSQSGSQEITVILDGKELSFGTPPMIMNGRTMVPMRAIFEAMGAKLDWYGDVQTAYAEMGETQIHVIIGRPEALVNGRSVPLDQPAVIVNGRTLVPLRFVAEALGASVGWNQETRTVTINSMEYQQSQQPGRQPGRIWGTGDQLPANAPWDQTQYRNNNLPSQQGLSDMNIRTNGNLVSALRVFNDQHASYSNNPSPDIQGNAIAFPPLSENDIRLKNMFIDIFCNSWSNDALSQVMPFNSNYVREVLSDVDIYFAGSSTFAGFYDRRPLESVNRMFVCANGSTSATTYVHEVGRALGLNHSLTYLLSNEFSGSYQPLNTVITYSTSFDGTLLNTVGAEQFWKSAFTSNDEYKDLWNQHMPVSLEDIEMFRSLTYRIQTGNSVIMQLYRSAGGTLSEEELDCLGPRFALAFDPRISEEFTPQRIQTLMEVFGSNNRDEVIRLITTTANIARQIEVGNVFEQNVRDDIIQNTPVAIAQREAGR